MDMDMDELELACEADGVAPPVDNVNIRYKNFQIQNIIKTKTLLYRFLWTSFLKLSPSSKKRGSKKVSECERIKNSKGVVHSTLYMREFRRRGYYTTIQHWPAFPTARQRDGSPKKNQKNDVTMQRLKSRPEKSWEWFRGEALFKRYSQLCKFFPSVCIVTFAKAEALMIVFSLLVTCICTKICTHSFSTRVDQRWLHIPSLV